MAGETGEAGWYLGLPYMKGRGLRAVSPGGAPPPHESADFIYVDDVLSASPDWRQCLREWWQGVKPGGFLILWLKDCRKQEVTGMRFTLEVIEHALDDENGWRCLECDEHSGHLFAVFEKTKEDREKKGWEKKAWKKAKKHALVIRTGAFGDALMAASIFTHLKAEGWAIDLLTNEAGEEVLRHDPYLSRILVLSKGQIEDAELPYFWKAHESRYDRVINLTFSVEGELLKQPFRGDYFWSEAQRRKSCGRSYLGRTHELADAPKIYDVKFYPAVDEKNRAAEMAHLHAPFILWCLKGSAVHKWWPHAPAAVCRILAHSDARVILSGAEDARDLAAEITSAVEKFYGNCERLIDLTEKTTIRMAMALAQFAKIVVGPETGVLNAVSFEKNAKVLFLSHSAPVNLSDDWVNTHAFLPKSPCYPCHRLHYGHEWCPRDEKTGAAACAASIGVDIVTEKILELLAQEENKHLKEAA